MHCVRNSLISIDENGHVILNKMKVFPTWAILLIIGGSLIMLAVIGMGLRKIIKKRKSRVK